MRQSTIVLLLVLAGAILALWFFNTHEKVSRDQWTGFHGKAQVNDHLAAQMLLRELGFEAESKATLTPSEWLPPTDDTILIRLTPSLTIGEERNAILNWVSEGGHLVLRRPRDLVQDVDEFLEMFGLRLVEVQDIEEELVDGEQLVDEPRVNGLLVNEPPADESVVDPANEDEYELIKYWDEHHIEVIDSDVDVQVVLDDSTIVVARREWGDGYITLLANPDYFNNYGLQENDHSRLLADVVAGEVEPGRIWLIYHTTFSPLWQVIWRAAPYLVLGLAILFVLWLWAVMPVFGPRIRTQETPRRSIIEHIRAAGIFIWHHHGGNGIADSSIHALLHEAELRHPGIGRQRKEKQAEIIAHVTGMSSQKVMDVLTGQPDRHQREFTHCMQRLQSIRKEL